MVNSFCLLACFAPSCKLAEAINGECFVAESGESVGIGGLFQISTGGGDCFEKF